MKTINLKEKLVQFSEHFSPRLLGQVNNTDIKLVKFMGEFIWHHHEFEDEMFLVLNGEFQMHFRDRIETVRAGECLIVPRGTEHKPVAAQEVSVMLIEPVGTLNTGNVQNERSVQELRGI